MIALYFGIIAAVVAVDLVTKFNINGILNYGIAWGFGSNLPWLWIVIVVISFLLVAVLSGWFVYNEKVNWTEAAGLGLFVGGILGNAIDRFISKGPVHDFINFGIFTNNIADIAITIGAIVFVVGLYLGEKRASR